MKQILVVETDRKFARSLRSGLEARGFAVDCIDDGDRALALATSGGHGALVLGARSSPGRSGLNILQELRGRSHALPVVLLTARGAVKERIRGLDLGADACLTRPVHPGELAAQLRALLRRATDGHRPGLLRHGKVTVDPLAREVRRDGEPVELTAREFALLSFLLRSAGRAFTREEILGGAWGRRLDPGTNLVDVHVRRLRKKLGADPAHPLIETVHGVGYRVPG